MLTRINKAMAKKDSGFTLIELLVVVIIIGILAAIAIPTFLNQRQAGFRGALESDLRNAATAAETYAVENNGEYGPITGPPANSLQLHLDTATSFNPSQGVTKDGTAAGVFVNDATATDFCVEAYHSGIGSATTDAIHFDKITGEPADGPCT